jgi:hypothetical protein
MKRQIICVSCHHPLKDYPGEWHKTVGGEARDDMICDLCGREIPEGGGCYAQSMGLDRHPYYPWEGEYIYVTVQNKEAP